MGKILDAMLIIGAMMVSAILITQALLLGVFTYTGTIQAILGVLMLTMALPALVMYLTTHKNDIDRFLLSVRSYMLRRFCIYQCLVCGEMKFISPFNNTHECMNIYIADDSVHLVKMFEKYSFNATLCNFHMEKALECMQEKYDTGEEELQEEESNIS